MMQTGEVPIGVQIGQRIGLDRTSMADKDTGNFTVGGAYSIKNFKMLFAMLHLPEMADRRFLVDVDAKWIDAPTVAFYGTGPDSSFDDKTLYGYEPLTVGVTARVRPVKAFTFGAGVNYVDINTSPADGKTVFTDRCGSCHTLSAAGTSGNIGPNLDEITLDAAAIEQTVRNGRGGMPPFGSELSDEGSVAGLAVDAVCFPVEEFMVSGHPNHGVKAFDHGR